MYVITFYSFKGGVGRTMALVNVAAELARRGRKVLVVDFDLEAPGLETYRHLRPPVGPAARPGIVEYVTKFRENYEVPDLCDYVYEAKPIGKRGGRLWVMPAGRRDRAYRVALTRLDWQRLYSDEQGFLLFEDTRKGWEVELQPDYVLIDSRTGDTDVLGICTRQLPDSVVLMFTPNEQNLAGLENVVRDIRREETEGLKKFIRLHFVAANVPDLDDENRILHRQLAAFRERLSFKDLSGMIRRYENLILLDQSVFTLDRPHSRLARCFRRILRTLLKDNTKDRAGALAFLADYPKRHETRIPGEQGAYLGTAPFPPLTETPRMNSPTGSSAANLTLRTMPPDSPTNSSRGHLLVVLKDDGQMGPCVAFWRDIHSLHCIRNCFGDDAEILQKLANCFILEEDFGMAAQVLDRVLQLDPQRVEALLRRASCRTNLGKGEAAADDLLAVIRLLGSPQQLDEFDLPSPTGLVLNELGRSMQHAGLLQRCLKRFCVLATPGKLKQLVELIQANEIQIGDIEQFMVTEQLCRREEGVPIAAQFLRGEMEKGIKVFSMALLRARCWSELIHLCESNPSRLHGRESTLLLALAYWGQNGVLPEATCKQALDSMEERLEAGNGSMATAQAVAVLLWGIGDKRGALEWLDGAEQAVRARTSNLLSIDETEEVFSWWRLGDVSAEQFVDDCQLFRRMFEGDRLRPPFLGPVSG